MKNFIRETKRAILRLLAGKGLLETPQERLNDIYHIHIPKPVAKLAASEKSEIDAISLDLPKGQFLVDVDFIKKEKILLDNLRNDGFFKFKDQYSKLLFVLLEKGEAPNRYDHLLLDKSQGKQRFNYSKNLLGFRSILVAPFEAFIEKPDKYQPSILIYKKEDDILYLANIGKHHDVYRDMGKDDFNFVSPINYENNNE